MLRHSGETTPYVGSLESISEMFSSSDSRTTDGQEFSTSLPDCSDRQFLTGG